ncbi:MAG: hypothetical protein LBV06_02325 [Propionibacteriaceae bacterium]|jgi:ABC-2 type transport system permease protein|nr:hypothetical protein [Propionibacteriaceae bacterium]
MRGYAAFLGKELIEAVRTYKLFLMLVIFGVFGMSSPLLAKLTPQMIASVVSPELAATIPAPSAVDAWTQFYKNVGQLGLVILIIMFSGVLANELSKGTLVNVVTKGLSRGAVILAKLTSMVAIWTGSLVLAAGLTWVYTQYLFGSNALPHLVVSVVLLWVFGVFLLSLLVCAATLGSNNWVALLITVAVVAVGLVAGIIPAAYHYNPLSLASQNMALITGTVTLGDLWPAIGITLGLIVVLVAAAIGIFRRRVL